MLILSLKLSFQTFFQQILEEHLEIDLFQRDWDLRHRQLTCSKNPGHENFYPVKEVSLEDLPLSLRHQEVFDYIQAVSQLVVRYWVA